MSHIPLVKTCIVSPLLNFLKLVGTPTDRHMVSCKLPRKALENPDSFLPVSATLEFFNRCADVEGLPTLGLVIGQQTQIGQLGDFGQLVQNSLTLFEGLQNAEAYIHTCDSSVKLWLERKGDTVWFCHQNGRHFIEKGKHGSFYALMIVLNLVRQVAGSHWSPKSIRLQTSEMEEVKQFEEFANAQLSFNQAYSALAIPAKFLPLRLSANPSFSLFNPDYLQRRLIDTAPPQNLDGSLRLLLRSHMHDGYPGIQRLADSAGTSVRTLQRRLEEERIQYSRMVEEVRFDLAVKLMGDERYKLKDIAQELGYRDCANFNRAFRRWAGISPSEYRIQHVKSR